MRQSDAWCVSCQRWLRCRCIVPTGQHACACFVHTCYDQQPKLYFGTVGAGKKWHLGQQDKPLTFCTVGEFKALLLACSEVIDSEKTPAICKNCVRVWRQAPVYKDFL